MLWDHTLVDLVEKGGLLMWPLLACSVVALSLFLDRTAALLRARLRFDRFAADLRVQVLAGDLERAQRLCERSVSPVARAAAAYLGARDLPAAERYPVVEREGSLALERVQRRLRGLSTIAQVATLIGLLGTVTGLVAAFHQIELRAGQVQPQDLAAGIWEALMTTVFGLSIAIPSHIAYHVFDSRVDAIARQMGHIVSYLDEWSASVRRERPEDGVERRQALAGTS